VGHDGVRHPAGGAPASPVELRLLGRFAVVVNGSGLPVSRTGQRLLARIALSDGVEDRAVLAGVLWPEHPGGRAQANLRGAVWRLPVPVRERLDVDAGTLAFDGGWSLDLHAAERLAADLRPGQHRAADTLPAAALFRYDLLPDCDESWLLVHRERYRQLRLHALEDLARLHLDAGRPFHATDCALLAIAAEPLRESSQRLLVCGHLAAGNRAAALASYEQFRRMLADELGVRPSPELAALVHHIAPAPRPVGWN
jgi:DNA-binding SARP family transcriptional activator